MCDSLSMERNIYYILYIISEFLQFFTDNSLLEKIFHTILQKKILIALSYVHPFQLYLIIESRYRIF